MCKWVEVMGWILVVKATEIDYGYVL
jgi:hypothetical protein